MGSIFYVIAIMGCGDGSAQCAQARIMPTHYYSAAQCQAAMPTALARSSDLDFPTLAASCRPVGRSIAGTRSLAPKG